MSDKIDSKTEAKRLRQWRNYVMNQTDLVGLIGELVSLKFEENKWVGLCPFHADTQPYLSVVTNQGTPFYNCFACGESGNAEDFMMRCYSLTSKQAMEFLSLRAQINRIGNAIRDIAKQPDKGGTIVKKSHCKTCSMPYDCHPDIDYYCAEGSKQNDSLFRALRERDKAIALLAEHMRYHNTVAGENGWWRMFMDDNGDFKPMGNTCYNSEVMIKFNEKGIP